MRNTYKILVRKLQGRRQFGRSREENIKMNLKETDYEGVEQINWSGIVSNGTPL
jgi:hypothetical protein